MSCCRALPVPKQGLESEVHVMLDVTVEQGQAWLVRDELDGRASVERHDDGVFENAARRLSVDLDHLEKMAVQVQRMRIVSSVAEDEAIPRSLLEHELLIVRVHLAVHRKAVEPSHPPRNLLEHHVDGLSRAVGRGWRARLTE